MSTRGVWIAVVLGVALAALAGWFFNTFEPVDTEIDAPLRGEARYNPFYALAKVLRARGFKVESRASFNFAAMKPGASDTVILGADVRNLGDAQVGDLLDWVDSGGHLVFSLPPAMEGRGGDLLDALSLKVVARDDCVRWKSATAPSPASYCSHWAFQHVEDADEKHEADDPLADFDLLVGDAKRGYALGRQTWGDGNWTAAGNLEFLHNRHLSIAPNAALAWQVLAPVLQEGATVHLIYATNVPPLYVLLLKYGWPVLLPLLIGLFAWLWARSQRFGPLLPAFAVSRRALFEHIHAAGEFEFRSGSVGALYAALRRRFFDRLRRYDPAIAALDGEALVLALAEKHARSPAQIRLALSPTGLTKADTFFATVKILHELTVRYSSPHP